MNYATGLFSSVFTLYTEINPSTLSGANDVIVVNNDGEFKCTPFELRFGKMDMFRITTRTIYLIVNNKMSDLSMTIVNNGDVLFLINQSELKINCFEDIDEEEVCSDSEFTCKKIKQKNRKVSWEKELAELENNFLPNLVEKTEKIYSNLYIEKVRRTNEEFRKFFLRPFVLPDLSKQYKSFKKLVNSYEYYSYLISNVRTLYHVLRGNWAFPGQKTGDCELKGCKKSQIRFSLCGDKRTTNNLKEIFDSFEIVNLRDFDQIIVQISDCKNNSFYFDHTFFSQIFFLVRNEIYRNTQQNIENNLKKNTKQSEFNFDELNPFLRYELKHVLGVNDIEVESFYDDRLMKLLEEMQRVASPEKVKKEKFISKEIKTQIKRELGLPVDSEQELKEELDLEILRKGLHELTRLLETKLESVKSWSFFKKAPKKKYWTTQLTSDQLKRLNLKEGKNEIIFKLSGKDKKLHANIFLWNKSDKIIISDIDGTITKSDIKGHLYSLVGSDWTHVGVAQFYTKLAENGYKFIYLTSRPLGQSKLTRYYLNNINQEGFVLPEGPIIHSTSGVLGALYREIILRSPEKFKIACLKKIKEIFFDENPFIAGFGNKPNDVVTYKALSINSSKIFIINPDGSVSLDIAKGLKGTHFSLNAFVNNMFPRVYDELTFDNSYNDGLYWKYDYN
ncbi:Smp2-like plasmid maintenance protein [Tubulinosema ratisbonensis]|uniref:Smp2-like plasmid maintenance protein n=1 Tax=Tubulinosema ratisbonensis TaxID=291195 RepID=A0A437AQV3_9MICR|nr:Smp2-like plasmid maintenance protein [Tubulinosema ratisbonensis]